ncbi:BREX-1 system adenine-specific DNA-methyltransferase PglX [Rhodococcus sp. NPDC060086]|uniref:BREX-1 system adenine-specific DNA-methyltransferase PglX n=1 Tax=Rhodococcus sp. NPDC060086 TaxID=3347055 RepID=UPI0036589230
MNTKPLESFAKAARRELIVAVEARVSAVLAAGSVARSERAKTVRLLESEIANHGREHVIDRVAYTWFNRLVALRFMDARGYTDAGVVSLASGQAYGQPEILADAKRGDIDTEVVTNAFAKDAIIGLLDGSRRSTDAEGEAYALLLTEYCRHWHKTMPFMFEAEGAYTELLVPAGLLAEGAVLSRARTVLTEDVCDDVEVIGWLYQFYISERKAEVFAGFKKNKKAGADEIPAATQLFTPHWIVRYLLENSLGRLWMLNRPASRLVDQMDYYIAPVDEETDFLRVSGPEELTVIDPACGSGHMLTYAFDLLYAIYEEEGYAPSEIPSLILTHNLHGTEIDPRAGALAAFALTMKARSKDRRFFNRSEAHPKICVIEPVSFVSDELDLLITKDGDRDAEGAFWNQFRDADTFGSLIQPDAGAAAQAAVVLEGLQDQEGTFYYDTLLRARRAVAQAEMLSRQYSVVTANPPYMGAKQMSALLSQFMKDEYPDVKQDLYSAFCVRGIELAHDAGLLAIVVGDTWMSLKSFEALRLRLLNGHAFDSFVHMRDIAYHPDIFGANAAFVLSMAGRRNRHAPFIRLTPLGSDRKEQDLRVALAQRTQDAGFHLASGADFASIPGSPIVYWLSEKMRYAFRFGKPLGDVAKPRQGMATADNARFVRQWWEVSASRTAFACTSRKEAAASRARWFPYTDGGEFRRWYGNRHAVVNWEDDGHELRAFERAVVRNPQHYFCESVSWSAVGSGVPAFRSVPVGSLFSNAGMSVFANPAELAEIVAICNSTTAESLFAAVAPTLNLGVGEIGKLPVLQSLKAPSQMLNKIVARSKRDWDDFETSWDFAENPLVALGKLDND